MAMHPAVTYTLYAMSPKEQNGDIITFAHFEEGKKLTEARNDAESGDKSDNESIMMNEEDMENIDSNEYSDNDVISSNMLEDIRD